MGLYTIICPIGVRNLLKQRQSAPVRQAVFLYLNFADRFSLPLKNDLKTQCREGGEYNTLLGNNPGRLFAISEPLGTLFTIGNKLQKKSNRSQL